MYILYMFMFDSKLLFAAVCSIQRKTLHTFLTSGKVAMKALCRKFGGYKIMFIKTIAAQLSARRKFN